MSSPDLKANYEKIASSVDAACLRSGRQAGAVEILVATKYTDASQMGKLKEAGVDLVGENRADDLVAKQEQWGDIFTWDFIGHLQSRKVKAVLPRVRLIHSLCSLSAAREIEKHAERDCKVLLEVNLAGEASKSGVASDEVVQFIEDASRFENVSFSGLMTMPPATSDPELSRPYFAQLKRISGQLADKWTPRHRFETLSMGTSQDYLVAIEEGATIVRIGSVLWQDPE